MRGAGAVTTAHFKPSDDDGDDADADDVVGGGGDGGGEPCDDRPARKDAARQAKRRGALSPAEVRGIAAHLQQSCAPFKPTHHLAASVQGVVLCSTRTQM
jgi:hypothetical protein